jgi:hypothetical protein
MENKLKIKAGKPDYTGLPWHLGRQDIMGQICRGSAI